MSPRLGSLARKLADRDVRGTASLIPNNIGTIGTVLTPVHLHTPTTFL